MANQPDKHARSVLPIPDPAHVGLTTYDAKDPDTRHPPIEPLRPPQGAPNVLVVLIDDCGFGAASAFGGPIDTPAFERLAHGGLRYSRFPVRGGEAAHVIWRYDCKEPRQIGGRQRKAQGEDCARVVT